MKYNQTIFKKILTVIFLITIFAVFIFNLSTITKYLKSSSLHSISTVPAKVENDYNKKFHMKLDFINLNGAFRKVMDQKIVNGVIKGKNGNLFLEKDTEYTFKENKEKLLVNKAKKIMNFAKESNAKHLYVQAPFKFIEGKDELPYGITLDQNKKNDYWYNQMKKADINSIDLRQTIKDQLSFYRTDHHWTEESAYYASNNIIDTLNNKYQLNLDKDKTIRNVDNYDVMTYKKSFLGSEGIRTGEKFTTKDDFSFFVPKFKTSLTYKHYVDHKLVLTKKGDFLPAFIDRDILNDKTYYNKYNANLYGGYCENIIINHNSDNKLKLLLISDSFSRPMVQYLSLAFHQTRYLDPQEGRYTDSYIDYIKKYQPDIVIIMYSGDFKQV